MMTLGRLILFIFLSLLSTNAIADDCHGWLCSAMSKKTDEPLSDIYSFVDRKTLAAIQKAKQSENSALVRVLENKEAISRVAYETTLDLCWAYRESQGLGHGHPYLHKDAKSFVYSRKDGTTKKYSLEKSLEVWAKIFARGLYQPIDGIVGEKADYIEIRNLGFFDVESWFASMYVIHLVGSPGFLAAATHCLPHGDTKEVARFASAIIAVDLAGSLTTETLAGWGVGKLGQIISRFVSRWWIASPLKTLFTSVKSKITKPMLIVAGVPTSIVLADNLMCKFARQDQAEQVLSSTFAQMTANDPEGLHRRKIHERIHVALKLYQSYSRSKRDCEKRTPSSPSDCIDDYKPFIQQLKDRRFSENLNDYIKDQRNAEQERQRLIQQSLNPAVTHNYYYCSGEDDKNISQKKEGALDIQQAYLDILDLLIPLTQSFQKEKLLE